MLKPLGGGIYGVAAPLTFASASAVLAASAAALRGGGAVTFDLAAVPAVDSAALALVVEWLRRGRALGAEVRLKNVPAALRDLARVCDCDELLPELAAP